jgi:hypothetical protein
VATIRKRLLTVCLALAFFVGATVQMLPSSMTTEEISLRTGVAGGGAGPQPPCGDHMPNCVDHVGCITVSALPASPGSEAVAFEWTPAPVPRPLFPLFYQVEIRHRNVRQSLPRTRSRVPCLEQYHAITAIEWLSIYQIHADNIGNYDAVVAAANATAASVVSRRKVNVSCR